MRARCERHGLALGPSGCLLCRREQGPDAAAEAAAQTALAAANPVPAAAAGAAPAVAAGAVAAPAAAAAPVSAAAATAAATAPAAGAAAATPLPDPPHAAPALVTDFPPPRQLSIHIPRSVLLLPAAGLALYLLVSLLPRSAPVGASAAKTESAAPAKQAAASATAADAPQGGDASDDGAARGEPGAVEPPVSPADLARLRERTRDAQQLAEARERVKVALFYTERCPHCSEARGYLAAHGVRAEQYDIDKDPKARARYLRLNPKGSLPTLVIEKQVLAGFDADRLEHALDRAARARLAPAPKRRRR